MTMEKTCGACEKSAPAGGRACRCGITGRINPSDHPCDVADMPRLCQVLGVAVGQRFKVLCGDVKPEAYGPCFISGDGRFNDRGSFDSEDAIAALTDAINHPEKIERVPVLTDKEWIRCRDFGAKWVSRDEDGELVHLWETEPEPQPGGVWAGGTSCAQAWDRFFPSVQPGQLIRVEDES